MTIGKQFALAKMSSLRDMLFITQRVAPNPERTVQTAPWLRVECCTRWPAHNESYINGLCGHPIHEGCILTLQQPFRMEACPVCCSHTTHFEREGWFLTCIM